MRRTEREPGAGYVRSLGVAEVVDASAPSFERVAQPVDVVIDTVGGLVSSVSKPDPGEASRRGVRAVFVLVRVTSAALSQIASMVETGKLTSRLGPLLRPSDARRAHEMLDGIVPREPGKIVLTP